MVSGWWEEKFFGRMGLGRIGQVKLQKINNRKMRTYGRELCMAAAVVVDIMTGL